MKKLRRKGRPKFFHLTHLESRLLARDRLNSWEYWTFVVPVSSMDFVARLGDRASSAFEITVPDGTYFLIFLPKSAFPAHDLAAFMAETGCLAFKPEELSRRDILFVGPELEILVLVGKFRVWLAGNPERN